MGMDRGRTKHAVPLQRDAVSTVQRSTMNGSRSLPSGQLGETTARPGQTRIQPCSSAVNESCYSFVYCSCSNAEFVRNRRSSRALDWSAEAACRAEAGFRVNQTIITHFYVIFTSGTGPRSRTQATSEREEITNLKNWGESGNHELEPGSKKQVATWQLQGS